MSYKTIAGLIPTMQSIALVNENLKQVNKKKTTTKDLVSLGTKNIVGVSLIQAESQIIGEL